MITIFISVFGIFSAIILLNYYAVRYYKRKALEDFVIPKLAEKGLIFINCKLVGLFGFGDFKDGNGKISPAYYSTPAKGAKSINVFVFYDDKGTSKRITARIYTYMFRIEKVVYSSDF